MNCQPKLRELVHENQSNCLKFVGRRKTLLQSLADSLRGSTFLQFDFRKIYIFVSLKSYSAGTTFLCSLKPQNDLSLSSVDL